MSAVIAWLMALVTGALIVAPTCRGAGTARVPLMLGYGAWVGSALVAASILISAMLGLGTSLFVVVSVLLTVTLTLNLVMRRMAVATPPRPHPLSSGAQALMVLFGALILLHTGGWFIEVWMNPLLAEPVLAGPGLEARRYWLAPADTPIPSMAGRLLLWPALVGGVWVEPGLGALWTLAGLALLMGGYAQLRIAGLSPLGALVAVYMLITLPLVGAQIMMPGNIEIWTATGLGLAWVAALNALRGGGPAQWVLAGVSALPLIGIGAGGMIWLLFAVLALVLARWPARWTLLALAVVATLGVLALTYHVNVDIGPLGHWGRTSDGLALGRWGSVPFNDDLALTITAREFVVFDAWHLIWLPLLAAPLLALSTSGGQAWWRAAMVFTVLAAARVATVLATTDELVLASTLNCVLLGAMPALWVGAVLMLVDWVRAGRDPLALRPVPAAAPIDGLKAPSVSES